MIHIAEDRSQFGVVAVYQSQHRASYLYQHGNVPQSEADDRGISLAYYIHALFGLVRQTGARRVLIIGCAGGSLATLLATTGIEVVAVDVNPVAFVFAHRYFRLPKAVKCSIADGADYLQSASKDFDIIVLDAYSRDVFPGHLRSPDFLALARARLNSGGCLLANVYVVDDRDRALPALAAAAARVWPVVRVLDSPGAVNRNAILTAGNVRDLIPPRLEIRPQHDANLIEGELASMVFHDAGNHAIGALRSQFCPISNSIPLS
jgi:spermidine synthase